MKYRLLLLFFLVSCINNSTSTVNKLAYSANGFVHIEQNIYPDLEKDNFFVSHNKLPIGTKVKVINPENKKFVEVTMKKKIKYDDFYKALISKSIAQELDLSFEFPYIEIIEVKINQAFVAKKTITDVEEKKIANNAPLEKIKIDNISKENNISKKKLKTYSIVVAEFYNLSSAELLKERLLANLKNSNYHLIYINKKSEKKYELLMGPYNTINKLKNDYIALTDSNFEDLNIKINE